MTVDGVFDAHAHDPTDVRDFGGQVEKADLGLEIGPHAAAGDVDHSHRPDQISDAGARGDEQWKPVDVLHALVGPLTIRLEAEDPVAGLPVVSDLPAGHDAVEVCDAIHARGGDARLRL